MKKEMTIHGMTCAHCIMAVRKELAKLEGLAVVDVQIGKAVVEYDERLVTSEAIEAAIHRAGYAIPAPVIPAIGKTGETE